MEFTGCGSFWESIFAVSESYNLNSEVGARSNGSLVSYGALMMHRMSKSSLAGT